MQTHFDLGKLEADRSAKGRAYLEFLRVPAMSAGIYLLPAGAADQQKPHHEDEIYYVVRGRARMSLEDAAGMRQELTVKASDIIFVAARREHRFHSIEEELLLLVFFAPQESDE